MFIGDIEVPIISDIVDSSTASVDEIKPLKSYNDSIDNVGVKHESSVQSITILGFLNSETHSNNLSIAEQKEKIKLLRNDRSKFDNTINYKDYKGHLLVEDVDFADNPDNRIINEVEIIGQYFPWPKYYPGDEP